jgi:hypothetical protein
MREEKIVSFFLGPSVSLSRFPSIERGIESSGTSRRSGSPFPWRAHRACKFGHARDIAGAPPDVIVSLAPRSITTPIAIEVPRRLAAFRASPPQSSC